MSKKILLIILCLLLVIGCSQPQETPQLEQSPKPTQQETTFSPKGVGGGGAMSGLSMSPYDKNLWFIGTDMGTLFRSTNQGQTWIPVSDLQTTYGYQLEHSAPIGFSADGVTLFHAVNGLRPQRSSDKGLTWEYITISADKEERVRYWLGHSFDENIIYAATNKGLYKTINKGNTWQKISSISGEAKGTFIDYNNKEIYHATQEGIYKASTTNDDFSLYHKADLRWFAGGAKNNQLTLTYIDNDNTACTWQKDCGYVWVKNNKEFTKTEQIGGRQIVMAENDPNTIYTIGQRTWPDGYGTKVWQSQDAGKSFSLVLHQLNWDVVPFEPWPQHKLEYSAVALDVGWWDDGYYWFTTNRRDSSQAGGSENFFVYTTIDNAQTWQAPFTKYADTGERTKGKKWRSTGLEVTAIRNLFFHPKDPELGYALANDISGMKTTDGGNTWQITNTGYNTMYDVAFTDDTKEVYAAVGTHHGWPRDWQANYQAEAQGGIFYSNNQGTTWQRVTPQNEQFNVQFLSVAYDKKSQTLYAGSHAYGIARKLPNKEWEWINQGLPQSYKIIPQIEINQETGDVYILLTGDKPDWTNQAYTGVYKWSKKENKWIHLRGTVHAVDDTLPWYYPTSFAIDFENNIMYLSDIEIKPPEQWMDAGIWKSIDNGENWHRTMQFTFPYHILIDPQNPSRVYATGFYEVVDKDWGNGGSYYSDDYGETWKKNLQPLRQGMMNAVTLDPQDNTMLYYSYHGGGITHNPRPE